MPIYTTKPLAISCKCLIFNGLFFVGVTGFEPATTWSQTRCATGLRYAPKAVSCISECKDTKFFLICKKILQDKGIICNFARRTVKLRFYNCLKVKNQIIFK